MDLDVKIVYVELHDYRGELRIETPTISLVFFDGEPEDNCLMRNFQDCYKIKELIELAYEAGLSGAPLNITEEREDHGSAP